ncbi:hypothetical protein [Acanthamoeba castellanii mimivirus]|uniref:Uncharacterized protein L448 n=5 Tax=Mimivirus TaxID=315393 RepID=YL448_MIMIV|nr:hypothetical protein MIMI_gp0481 [Acanthamoeba polyphaga mimivirus]Q5UQP0.1 RecName: Full=Uncharacterized protein L448 [Acanthamoeba polyphaga mimivirus]AEQ60634.1 hypothetical protein [Acanthamoeba castellanii mamavirus]AHA45411.1 hypothetical protein HIRU_S505 [Hirudovirus strain Sangsue]AHJ40133.1 hypothetical protein [Samba virus]ALR84038.1 hypothetical protein [Niemeyer virus]AMZ02892.1 hypothetical protein [Mimivirus Bombay]EJN40884.1 hypothetical protein lvs_L380 [Acanthamoeba poly
MYSNITKAWHEDPVKEITSKLSKGYFNANKNNKFENERSSEISDKILDKNPKYNFLSTESDLVSLTENNLHLLSNNSAHISDLNSSEFGNYAPVDFATKIKPHNISNKHLPLVSSKDSECDFSMNHIKHCNICYGRLKELINNKVSKKMDEIILDNKIKQIQSFVPSLDNLSKSNLTTDQSMNNQNRNTISNNDLWKTALIIIIGIVIILLLIIVMIKTVCK